MSRMGEPVDDDWLAATAEDGEPAGVAVTAAGGAVVAGADGDALALAGGTFAVRAATMLISP